MRQAIASVPARRTRLIGRDVELGVVRDLVLQLGRLTTLTGTGGAGKTSLAMAVARAIADDLPDGVCLVDLEVVTEAERLLETMCATLGLIDQTRPPDVVLTEFLEPRQALLVLDNCEHLVASVASLVDRLLDACPDLRILVTSRIPLRVRGESVVAVPPLPVPPPGAAADERNPAVALFVERARAARSSFELSPEIQPAVASICRRLEGLPLALELAAAQASALSPAEIEARLAGAGTLPGPARDSGPIRQRTLEATLDWSYRLLRPAEQRVFRMLAVFSGGWSLEAAEAVCAEASSPVADALVGLVEASLVLREPRDQITRFRFLAPIAEYARSLLEHEGELAETSAKHAAYYLELAGKRSNGGQFASPEDLDRIDCEYENCVAALRWAQRELRVPVALGMTRALLEYWRVRGLLRPGLRHLNTALGLLGDAPSYPRALVLLAIGDYCEVLSDLDTAETAAHQAEQLLVQIGEERGRATAYGVLGNVALDRGDLDTARALYLRARELVVVHPAVGETPFAFWYALVGALALKEGCLDEARENLEESRRIYEERPPVWFLGRTLTQLGSIARAQGNGAAASGLLIAALEHLRRFGARVEAIDCLEELGRAALDGRDAARAATLFAAAGALREAAGIPSAVYRLPADEIDRVRASLPSSVFASAWAAGRTLGLDEAIVFATSESPVPLAGASPADALLTAREREVAELVAEGLTNRQIAQRLVISPGTVKIHVERILGKLGLTTRVQIATWVLRESGRRDAEEVVGG